METALFILAIAAAGLFCPAMMWWQRRRGKAAACCVPGMSPERDATASADVDDLRRQHERLAARIAELELDEADRPAARS